MLIRSSVKAGGVGVCPGQLHRAPHTEGFLVWFNFLLLLSWNAYNFSFDFVSYNTNKSIEHVCVGFPNESPQHVPLWNVGSFWTKGVHLPCLPFADIVMMLHEHRIPGDHVVWELTEPQTKCKVRIVHLQLRPRGGDRVLTAPGDHAFSLES